MKNQIEIIDEYRRAPTAVVEAIQAVHAAHVNPRDDLGANMPKSQNIYHVTLWETGEVIGSYPLGLAKRYARGKGHTGEDDPLLTGYPPIAFVADDNGNCVYNPRFGKQIGNAGNLINALDADWF